MNAVMSLNELQVQPRTSRIGEVAAFASVNDIEILQSLASLETITPSVAARILRDHTYRLQRILDLLNFDQMDRTMARGEFPITMMTLCKDLETGRTDLLDGWHRLGNSRDNGHTFRAILQHLTVRTQAEKEALWMFLDGGGKTRVPSDYRALFSGELAGLNQSQRFALEKASAVIANRFSERYLKRFRNLKTAPGERVQTMQSYLPHAKRYLQLIHGASPAIVSPLRSGFLIAFGSVLIEAQSDIAVPFFESIAGNSELKDGDPRHLFFNSLSRSKAVARDVFPTMQRLAYCWNSHYSREKRYGFGKLGEGIEVPLSGTTFSVGG